MHVSYAEEIDCATAEEACALLRMRAETHDDVWMSRNPGETCLTVLVNGSFACVQFFESPVRPACIPI